MLIRSYSNKIWFFLILACLFSVNVEAEKEKLSKKQRVHLELIKKTPLYQDQRLAKYINKVGQALVKNSEQPNREFKFYVLDDAGINAFTPGNGYIYINRGLIALMNSEAELAGVLAHEIGHNTGNHLGRIKTRSILSGVAATAASIITGSGSLGQSISLVAQARISGLGREMELEADEYAAHYLYKTNYDPNQMLRVLGILKDHERFSRVKSKNKRTTYHGTFSTHPRSDKRLKEVVEKAGVLPPGEAFVGREALRKVIDGMVYGEHFDGNKPQGKERFANKKLGVTFLYPSDWDKKSKGNVITLKDSDKTIQLKIEVIKVTDKTANSETLLKQKYTQGLKKITSVHDKKNKDSGVMSKINQERVAAIRLGRHVYYFQGIAKNNQLSDESDQKFIEIIKSFRRVQRKDFAMQKVKRIYFKRLEPGESFASLAKKSVLGIYAEEELRLLNGYYPKGEAEPGTWIKLIKQEHIK